MRIKCNVEHRKAGTGRFLRGITITVAAMVIAWCIPFVSLADATGTVVVESAKIRGSADTSSDAVGSITKGKTVSIRDEVTDASGTLWYQVYVDANTLGYVRADLIEKTGGDTGSDSAGGDSAGQDSTAQQGGQGASAEAQNAMDAQYASVAVEAAKIRSAPSTNDSVVERLVKGTQMVVSGQSNGSSDGKVWYYITFTGADNTEKTGYVRSDLVTLGDMVPVAEEPAAPEEPEEQEPQETVNQDYEVVFKNGEWYLLDNKAGYEQKLQPLLDGDKQEDDTAQEDAKKLVKQRIAIVVLGVLAAGLLVLVIIMGIKLRDAYYEDYEDDEEDEEDEDDGTDEAEDEDEEVPVRRRKRTEDDADRENEQPSRRSVREAETPSRRPVRESAARREEEGSPRVKPAAKNKSKNFLLDDDEFEFEFLNMDDKDL